MNNIPTDTLNERLFNNSSSDSNYGLAHGKIGIIIYLYELWNYTNEENYKIHAEYLLDSLLENDFSMDNTELSIEDGMCGILLGVDYIISKGYVEGDINTLSKEVDDLLFKLITFEKPESKYTTPQIILFLYYIHKRLKSQTENNERFLLKELAIKLINKLDILIDSSFFEEYYTFSIYKYHVPILMKCLFYLIQYDFYSEKIRKIIERITLNLFAHRPHLHINRLYLLWSVLPYLSYSPTWEKYIFNLKESIDLDIIFEKEIKGKNIYISNGYAFLYILLENLMQNYPEYAIPFNPRLIYDNIISSEAWESLIKNEYYYNIHKGLYNGFPGTLLVLLDIKKKYL